MRRYPPAIAVGRCGRSSRASEMPSGHGVTLRYRRACASLLPEGAPSVLEFFREAVVGRHGAEHTAGGSLLSRV